MQELKKCSAFDSIAAEYDTLWTETAIGMLQRQAVWRELEAIFHPGDYILEIGCGTGMDAAHLAAKGIRVHATDSSMNMLLAANRRIEGESISSTVTLEYRAVEDLSQWEAPSAFDGAFSNFGVFNCVRDLHSAASSLSRLLRPRGKLGICLMSRFCLWEAAWYCLQGRPGKGLRRLRGRKNGVEASLKNGPPFRVYYPTAACLIRAFQPDFRLISSCGIGVLVPPSCMEARARRRPGVLEQLAAVDRRIRHLPILRAIGDHRVYWFERRV